MRPSPMILFVRALAPAGILFLLPATVSPFAQAGEPQQVELRSRTASDVAVWVDKLIAKELHKTGTDLAPQTSDEDFLRRVTLDLAGRLPVPAESTLFGIDPNPRKRMKLIDRLVASDQFAENWARYWRDVIFFRATDKRSRRAQRTFELWMTEQLRQNQGWDEITTALLTATGDVTENGETALLFAHGGQARELAAETSRIFLGIQIQCANCHDHPNDVWKREQFHQLAAYFPRIRIRRNQDSDRRSFEVVSLDINRRRRGFPKPAVLMRRLDANNDGKLTRTETKDSPIGKVFDRLLRRADTDQDQVLSIAELKKVRPPNNRRRGTIEYFMPDLSDPSSRGRRIDPVFFVDQSSPQRDLKDVERREALARSVTSTKNPWFARAFVNRIWAELLGEGFYMPVDDIGPERDAAFPEVLDLLSAGFTANSHDIKWLFRTIAGTDAYQREIRARDASDTTPPFASAVPIRLRADQIYNAMTNALGVQDAGRQRRKRRPAGPNGRNRSPRARFAALFGFDPSTPQQDTTGTIPQALFMMNSELVNNRIRSDRNTRLGQILRRFDDNTIAVSELYLQVLVREPSEKELKISVEYIRQVNDRQEAFEDLMWSLLNSSEFLTKR